MPDLSGVSNFKVSEIDPLSLKVTITFADASGVGLNLIFPVAASKQKCDLNSWDLKTTSI